MTFSTTRFIKHRHPEDSWRSMTRQRTEDIHFFTSRNIIRPIQEQIWDEIAQHIYRKYPK